MATSHLRISFKILHQPGTLMQRTTPPLKIIYSPGYDISCFGIERLHPFDSRKHSRAWALLKQAFGPALSKFHERVDRPVRDEELLLVHSLE